MPEDRVRGKNLAAVASDIADGFMYLSPLILKDFSSDVYKDLYNQLRKLQTVVRMEKFPSHNQTEIRNRNMRLQRLHQAVIVLQNYARMKRIVI